MFNSRSPLFLRDRRREYIRQLGGGAIELILPSESLKTHYLLTVFGFTDLTDGTVELKFFDNVTEIGSLAICGSFVFDLRGDVVGSFGNQMKIQITNSTAKGSITATYIALGA
jgi:hypothetical protein